MDWPSRCDDPLKQAPPPLRPNPMPFHLYWGDDEAARSRAIEALVDKLIDPAWSSINLSRLDGNDAGQAAQALAEARTPPLDRGPGW